MLCLESVFLTWSKSEWNSEWERKMRRMCEKACISLHLNNAQRLQAFKNKLSLFHSFTLDSIPFYLKGIFRMHNLHNVFFTVNVTSHLLPMLFFYEKVVCMTWLSDCKIQSWILLSSREWYTNLHAILYNKDVVKVLKSNQTVCHCKCMQACMCICVFVW